MSIEAVALVLHHSRASSTDKLVLVGIANHEGDGGAWPKVATLARYANIKERALQYSIGRLVALGELRVDAQAGPPPVVDGRERPDLAANRYEVLVTCPPECDRTKNHRVQPVAPRGANGVQSGAQRGAIQRANGVQPVAPLEPSLEPSLEPTLCAPPPASLARAAEFEAFWVAYPRSTDKAKARQAWGKLCRDRAMPDLGVLLAAVEAYKRSEEVRRGVVCHGSTWLNRRRWEDFAGVEVERAEARPPSCPDCGICFRGPVSCLTPSDCPMMAVAGD